MNNIKTFADACIACGITEEQFNALHNQIGLSKDTIAYEKLKIISAALNGTWKPDFTDHDQRKYFPYFYHSNVPGSAFSFNDCDFGYDYSYTRVGSRLCFKDYETAKYAGENFINEYNEFLK